VATTKYRNIRCITELCLQQKLLNSLPSLSEFVSLKYLDISCNKLKHLNFISTCTVYFFNSTLISLNLCNNKLTKLPNLHLTFPKLETLELWGNQLEDTEHLLDNLAKCENLREISIDESISKSDAGDSANFNNQLITQMPQLIRVNGKEIRKTDALQSFGVGQTHARQRQVYDLIERQLSSLAQVTSPMIASVNKSYDIIQELLTKVDEDMQQRSELALVEAQNPTRSSIKTKLKEALDFASSATNKSS
ncbi:uncharacterized protein DEA37_0009833, partial [Paragonimus westermani]